MQLMFDNGYGVSVIDDGYGSPVGLSELAVLHKTSTDSEPSICYYSPITDDVIGWLTDDEVADYIEKIKALEPNNLCQHKPTLVWEEDC